MRSPHLSAVASLRTLGWMGALQFASAGGAAAVGGGEDWGSPSPLWPLSRCRGVEQLIQIHLSLIFSLNLDQSSSTPDFPC